MIKAAFGLAIVGAALSGCTTPMVNGPVDVTRYHLGAPLERGSVKVEPLPGGASASIEFQTYAAAVDTQLLSVGYTAPAIGAPAQYLAVVSFTRTSRDIGPERSPVSIGLGGGVIGLLAVQLARNAGAEVILVTRHPAKRDLALQVGATETAATETEARALLPQGADLVLECAGVAETVEMAPRLTRSGGRVVILGVLPQGETVRIEPFDLLFREIRLLHSFINPFTQARAAAMLTTGKVQVAPLISRVIPLSEAPRAIANPAAPGEVKVLVVPD